MKDFFLTNQEIRELIDEPKRMDRSAGSILQGMKAKGGKFPFILQNSHKFPRQNGRENWLIYLRFNTENPLDFSCGLGLLPEGRRELFSIRRYNGKSHRHTNRLDGQQIFYDFHIHQTTEKYQRSSYKDDHYADPTDRYTRLEEAFRCLLKDFNVMEEGSDTPVQTEMFQ